MTRVVIAIAVAAGFVTVPLLSQRLTTPRGTENSGPVPMLNVSAYTVDRNNAQRGGVSAGLGIASGKEETARIQTVFQEGDGLCGLSTGSDGADAKPNLAWDISARLVSAGPTFVTVDLQWSRRPAGIMSAIGPVERSIRLELSEEQGAVLDFARFPHDKDIECEAAVVEIRLSFIERLEVAQASLDYDVWLIHRDAIGQETTDHLSPRGRQGKTLDYLFVPLQFDRDGRAAADGPLTIGVSGTVKGRVRLDGLIDVSVAIWRNTSGENLMVGEGGFKEATLEDGETVEFEPPPFTGTLSRFGRLATVFAGHRTVVRITARRAF